MFSDPEGVAPLAARGFCFPVPASWEITAFSLHPDRGRFHLHTRDGFQGQVSFRTVKGRPDLERMARDAWRQCFPPGEHPEGPLPEPQRQDHAVWCAAGRAEPIWVGMFNFRQNLLIEWVFPGMGKERRKSVLEPIVRGFDDNSGPVRRWALFGLDVSLPPEYTAEKLEPYPADASLTFIGPKDHRIKTRRVGFARHHLATWGGPRFLRGALTKGAVRVAGDGLTQTFRIGGRRGYEILLGRRWHGRGDLAVDEGANRLLIITQTAPKQNQLLEPRDVWSQKI